MRADGEAEWQDMLAAEGPDQESTIAEANELAWRRGLLTKAMETLNEREQPFLKGRRLTDASVTLADLGQIYGPEPPRRDRAPSAAAAPDRGPLAPVGAGPVREAGGLIPGPARFTSRSFRSFMLAVRER